MNKTKLIAVVVLAGAAYAAYVHKHASIIIKMYPDLEPKLVRKAHSIMVKRALVGTYEGMGDDHETMDKIFRAVYKELTASK